MLIVDRIEEEFALCERDDRSILPIPLTDLPEVREGDVLVETRLGYQVDQEETKRRRAEVLARLRRRS